MSATSAAGAPARHPWLDALVAVPAEQFARLIAGTARLGAYDRAEPDDAAAMLLAGLDAEDPARLALDQGALAWLEAARREQPADRSAQALDPLVAAAITALAIVQRLRLPHAALDLRDRFPLWMSWASGLALSPARDLRGAYLRCLAATQQEVAAANCPSLAPMWTDICRRAGADDGYPAVYLQIGLMGLRALPTSSERPEGACLQGLDAWATARCPSETEFLRQWRALRAFYRHPPAFWRGLVATLNASAAGKSAPAHLGWLRQDVRLGVRSGSVAPAVSKKAASARAVPKKAGNAKKAAPEEAASAKPAPKNAVPAKRVASKKGASARAVPKKPVAAQKVVPKEVSGPRAEPRKAVAFDLAARKLAARKLVAHKLAARKLAAKQADAKRKTERAKKAAAEGAELRKAS